MGVSLAAPFMHKVAIKMSKIPLPKLFFKNAKLLFVHYTPSSREIINNPKILFNIKFTQDKKVQIMSCLF